MSAPNKIEIRERDWLRNSPASSETISLEFHSKPKVGVWGELFIQNDHSQVALFFDHTDSDPEPGIEMLTKLRDYAQRALDLIAEHGGEGAGNE